jgi:WD40 repeat protein
VDENQVVAGTNDGQLQLWNVTARFLSARLFGHNDAVNGLALTPDGRKVVSVGKDGLLVVQALPDALAGDLCTDVWRNMSHEEWREFVDPNLPYHVTCPGRPVPQAPR